MWRYLRGVLWVRDRECGVIYERLGSPALSGAVLRFLGGPTTLVTFACQHDVLASAPASFQGRNVAPALAPATVQAQDMVPPTHQQQHLFNMFKQVVYDIILGV